MRMFRAFETGIPGIIFAFLSLKDLIMTLQKGKRSATDGLQTTAAAEDKHDQVRYFFQSNATKNT